MWPLAIQNLSCVLWGDHVFLPALNDDPGVRCYLDSPRILLFSMNARKAPGGADGYSVEMEIDLRRDVICAVARDPAQEAGAVRRKIWYGLLEGALEHEVGAQEICAMNGDASAAVSTSALLDGNGVRLLEPRPSTAGWEALAASRQTAAKLAGALASGNLVVVSNKVIQAGEPGWWAISAQSADTRAVLGDDINGVKYVVGRNSIRPVGGNSGGGGGVYEVDPTNYTSRKVGNMGPNYEPTSTKRGGGSEYAELLQDVSIPGAQATRSYVTPAVLAAAGAAIAALAWYDFH